METLSPFAHLQPVWNIASQWESKTAHFNVAKISWNTSVFMHVFVCVVGIVNSWWSPKECSTPKLCEHPQNNFGWIFNPQGSFEHPQNNLVRWIFNPQTLGHCKPQKMSNIPQIIFGWVGLGGGWMKVIYFNLKARQIYKWQGQQGQQNGSLYIFKALPSHVHHGLF